MIRDSEEITEDAAKYADAMIAKYHLDQPNAVMEYPTPAKNLPANWHTAMAELMLSMILLDMGDALERSDYTNAGIKLFESTTRDMSEGGTVARDAEGATSSNTQTKLFQLQRMSPSTMGCSVHS